ncbi:rhodanese-like domain-containing protein [Zoogloea sp.]|uniref:rhodanese-like domain-containing protein n=1 Tax=Zoogloea sp. TaxID=49181 RepID=UPI0035B12B85
MKYLKTAVTLAAALFVLPALAQQNGGAPNAAQAAQVYKTPKLGKAQIDTLLAYPEKVVFVDLRRPDELTKIGGFPVYLSIQLADLEKSLAYIPKDRQVVTVSNHAVRALKAGDVLLDKGFKVVGAAGVQNYEEEGGTLTKIAPPQPRPQAAAR